MSTALSTATNPLATVGLPRVAALLLPYQRRWLMDTAKVRVFSKSRRVGITWATAAAAVLEAASGRADVWYVGYAEDASKEFIRDVAQFAEWFHVPAREGMVELIDFDEDNRALNVKALGVTFPGSKKRVIALTSNPRSLRGKQGIVIIDEAAFHTDLDALLKSAMALRMLDGEVWILSTHNGEHNPFNQLCNDVRDGKKPFSLHECKITDAIAEGYYRQVVCVKRGCEWTAEGEALWLAEIVAEYGDDAQEELFCVPVGAGDSYIPRELVKPCMVIEAPVLRFMRPKEFMSLSEEQRKREVNEWIAAELDPCLAEVDADPGYRVFSLGFDFGRHADLSVVAPMGLRQDLVRRVPFLVELGGGGVGFAEQWMIVEHIMRRLPRLLYSCFDAGAGGAWIAEQAWLKFGEDRVEQVQLSLSYYREFMPALRQVFERRTIQVPSDTDVMRDLALIRRVNGVPKIPDLRTDSVSTPGSRRHGDAAVAIFLANVGCEKAEQMYSRWDALCTM